MTHPNAARNLFTAILFASVLTAASAWGQEPATSKPMIVEVSGTDVEVIKERYPNRSVKIEREVIRDADDNYINHGAWKMWDINGKVVAQGRYSDGERQGTWTGWFLADENKLFNQVPYSQFRGPFVLASKF